MSGGRGRGLQERPRAPPETARERGPWRRWRWRAGPRGRRGGGDRAAAGGSERGRRGGLGGGEESFPGIFRPSCRVRIFPGTRGAQAAGPASCGVGPGLTGRSMAVRGRGAAAVRPPRRTGHGWPGPGRAPLGCPLGGETRGSRSCCPGRPGRRRALLPASRLVPPCSVLAGFRVQKSDQERGQLSGPPPDPQAWPVGPCPPLAPPPPSPRARLFGPEASTITLPLSQKRGLHLG